MGLTISQPNNKNLTPTDNPIFGGGNIQTFFQSGTFTLPTGVKNLKIRVWGAGGGGGGGVSSPSSSGGGGGGGYAEKVISSPNATYTVTIGAGGISATNGGTTSFGSAASATGGTAGSAGSSFSAAAGGTGSSGDINRTGGAGGPCVNSNMASGTGGGSAAGPWGTGFPGGGAQSSGTQGCGGGGIGGPGGGGNNAASSGAGNGECGFGGGGSAGGAYNLQGGPGKLTAGQMGKTNSRLDSSSYPASTSNPYTMFPTAGIISLENMPGQESYGRFLGDIVAGHGGGGITLNAVGNQFELNAIAGNGGPGGGGGGIGSKDSPPQRASAGRGGVFGGGGGVAYNGNSFHNRGGDGGIGGGGGGNAHPSSQAQGRGGDGLVVVEW